MSETVRISEIFGPTIQGEGALIGQPTVFVRTGGCDYRCVWCDTLHAVDSAYREDWKPMRAEDIMSEVERLSGGKPLMISLSGGNPAIQDLSELIELGHARGYEFALETQGSIAQSWFEKLDVLTLSPKPPSSTMETDFAALDQSIEAAGDKPEIALKIVIFDEADYAYAKSIAARYPAVPLYLQPGNHKVEGESDVEGLNKRMLWLIERAAQDNWFNVTILPQLHVMLWGNKRGV